ncbi:MAG: hypothetical protein R2860_09140 [Desulfobacterales bacterium]
MAFIKNQLKLFLYEFGMKEKANGSKAPRKMKKLRGLNYSRGAEFCVAEAIAGRSAVAVKIFEASARRKFLSRKLNVWCRIQITLWTIPLGGLLLCAMCLKNTDFAGAHLQRAGTDAEYRVLVSLIPEYKNIVDRIPIRRPTISIRWTGICLRCLYLENVR